MKGWRPKLTRLAKRGITADWHSAFPGLGVLRPMTLVRRVGPILEGIILDRTSSGEVYVPIFFVHFLWRSTSVISLDIAQPLGKVRYGSSVSIPVSAHEGRWRDAANHLREQTDLPLTGPLHADSVLAMHLRCMEASGGGSTAQIEDLATLYAWVGRSAEAHAVISARAAAIALWRPIEGVAVETAEAWRQRNARAIGDPAALVRVVEEQVDLLGAADMPVTDFLFEPVQG